MSRILMILSLVAFASVGAAACHNSGPAGDMGNQGGMGNDPMNPMYRTHAKACAQAQTVGACAVQE
jgi:hypothetical protein